MAKLRYILRAIGFSALVLISWAFFAVAGATWGVWRTYAEMAPIVEERTIRSVNECLDDAKVRRFRFRTGDDGSVHLIIRRDR